MFKYIVIDNNGLFVGDKFSEVELNMENLINVEVPCGLFLIPKWDKKNKKWVEGGEIPTMHEPQKSKEEIHNEILLGIVLRDIERQTKKEGV